MGPGTQALPAGLNYGGTKRVMHGGNDNQLNICLNYVMAHETLSGLVQCKM